MDNRINIKSILTLIILFLSVNIITECQVTSASQIQSDPDSLSLKDIIKVVVTSHPTVSAAKEAINNADARLAMAKAAYYPDADITANFANMGPVTKLTIPDFGAFELFPANNYSASVNYRQVVYDFGRTLQNIEIENENKVLGEQMLEQVKQKLSLFVVNNYYTLVFLQAAIKIKEEQIAALNEHLSQVEKMLATGSATEYQVLATKVKISTVESQKVDLIAALTAQQASMNSLTGNDFSKKPVVKNELTPDVPLIPADSLLSYAFKNRDEVLMDKEKTSLAELRYGIAKLHNKPVLSFQASAGAKNGYIPDLAKFTPNYVLGLGIRIPLFDNIKNKYTLAQAQSTINSLSFESDYTKRNISSELYEAEAYMTAAVKKVTQFELQLSQALKANSLAETSFKSGMITNLDLLDANTSVSESRLMLLKARIDYVASIYKLKAALGQRIY